MRNARLRARLVSIAVCATLLAAACSRADDSAKSSTKSAPSTTGPSTTTARAAGPGDFGSIAGLCGPGDASGATARGVTDTEIKLGTMADPTNAVLPGIGQESFDIGNAFVKWCNAAGGILGRKLKLTTRDAKLFEVGARMIEACATDFMLVGSANPLDEAGVAPRKKCDLGQIPAYVVSAPAAEAANQVVVDSSIHQVGVGSWRALARVYPDAFKAVSFISVDGGGLDSFAMRQRDAMQALGYKVVDFQLAPIIGVANWRPYAQNASGNGARAVVTLSPDIDAFVRSMKDVGWTPALMPLGVQNYSAATIALAKEGVLPTTYVTTSFWPFESAADNPTVRQAIALIKSAGNKPPDFAHLQALSAWLLWATAAKACGSELTTACVVAQAGALKDWTAGGLRAPVDTHVGAGVLSTCFTLLKATAGGFVLDASVTRPNKDIFNCDPSNVVAATKTYTGT
jgi:ABC-type branched-subunit amino acid transport system substrate-binding protein